VPELVHENEHAEHEHECKKTRHKNRPLTAALTGYG